MYPGINLDEDQRNAVRFDGDHCLLIAGACAGKPATMVAKGKYLVEVKCIKPEEILVFSYTRKAIDELKERIEDVLGPNMGIIKTFHAFGLELINKYETTPVRIEDKEGSLENIISDMLTKLLYDKNELLQEILSDLGDYKDYLQKILSYFGNYFDLPDDAAKYDNLHQFHSAKAAQDYETLKSHLGEHIKKEENKRENERCNTLEGEYLRSVQEVRIANFLYLNGLDYEYEPVFKVQGKEIPISGSKKKYTPDFIIRQGENVRYLEHWGLNEGGTNDRFADVKKYNESIDTKRNHHKDNGSCLLETRSHINEKILLEHLEEVLKKAGFDFELNKLTPEDVYKKIVETSEGKYIDKFVKLMRNFIKQFKTRGYEVNDFENLKEKAKDDPRSQLFLDIAKPVYEYYQKQLAEKDEIDFEDMINKATQVLDKFKSDELNLEDIPDYKYIIIDEFQDISQSRFNLIKRLIEIRENAKIVAVGDDWQSIFAFAGSDPALFRQFKTHMGSGKDSEMYLKITYRNCKELITIAGKFVEKDSILYKKELESDKTIDQPIELIDYDDDYTEDENYKNSNKKNKKIFKRDTNLAEAVEKIIDRIIEEQNNPNPEILLLGRYKFDLKNICKTGKFKSDSGDKVTCLKHPKAENISFLTVHRAKGLGYDHVIILNMSEGKYGFPCQIEDDPVMKLVRSEDDFSEDNIDYPEERRLFYVALTRTKNRVYILTPQRNPSRFLIELDKDRKIKLPENVNAESIPSLVCPKCGYPLKDKKMDKNYGIELYRCSNEPELCDFMAVNTHGGELICKCPECSKGYWILKERSDGKKFYGCTEFHESGCKCTQNIPFWDDKVKLKDTILAEEANSMLIGCRYKNNLILTGIGDKFLLKGKQWENGYSDRPELKDKWVCYARYHDPNDLPDGFYVYPINNPETQDDVDSTL
jgi:DNA helicase-4